MTIEKKDSINEHIDRIKFVSKYQINEATYTLVDNIEEDDAVPDEIFMEEPTPVSPSSTNEAEPQMNNEGLPVEEPAPEMGAEEVPVSTEEPTPEMGMEEPMPEPEQPSVDQIQNDIIKKSVSAMQQMNDQLSSLESTLGSLNSKFDGLNKEVEEVREPTNVEKLVARKNDSHPFYYNLNDMWDDNYFQARRQVEDSEGMKQMEDGSYVADFDSLPKYTDQEVKDSF